MIHKTYFDLHGDIKICLAFLWSMNQPLSGAYAHHMHMYHAIVQFFRPKYIICLFEDIPYL